MSLMWTKHLPLSWAPDYDKKAIRLSPWRPAFCSIWRSETDTGSRVIKSEYVCMACCYTRRERVLTCRVVHCSHGRISRWHCDCQDGRVFPCRHWNSTFSRPAHDGIWRRHQAQQAQPERAVARLLQSVHGKSWHGARARMRQSQNRKSRWIWWIGGWICDQVLAGSL